MVALLPSRRPPPPPVVEFFPLEEAEAEPEPVPGAGFANAEVRVNWVESFCVVELCV